MKIHEDVTAERIEEAVEESLFGLANPGFCTACGVEVDGVEPDARKYECDSCGELAVYGAEELLVSFC